MPGMNINLLRNAVIKGQIATIKAQIVTWEIYASRTGENVATIITALQEHIARLELMVI